MIIWSKLGPLDLYPEIGEKGLRARDVCGELRYVTPRVTVNRDGDDYVFFHGLYEVARRKPSGWIVINFDRTVSVRLRTFISRLTGVYFYTSRGCFVGSYQGVKMRHAFTYQDGMAIHEEPVRHTRKTRERIVIGTRVITDMSLMGPDMFGEYYYSASVTPVGDKGSMRYFRGKTPSKLISNVTTSIIKEINARNFKG